jgi:PHD/YefM family antitoxin component YafN of YafNO toxin-antitoxin module
MDSNIMDRDAYIEHQLKDIITVDYPYLSEKAVKGFVRMSRSKVVLIPDTDELNVSETRKNLLSVINSILENYAPIDVEEATREFAEKLNSGYFSSMREEAHKLALKQIGLNPTTVISPIY